jgi:centromeric protein E
MQKIDNRIKVFIRPRPLFPSESKDSFHYSSSTISLKAPISKTQSSFTFDKVFSPSSDTLEVFESTTKEILDHALEGYNGTVFAYGQTTSGKTHTMIGSSNGIIPQSLNYLYEKLQKINNTEFKIWVSFLEIYNEVINDLLDTRSINLKIREDPVEGYFVAGLKQVPCHSVFEALKVLDLGEKQRSYRATNIHEHSSRSHSVFRVLIESKEFQGVDADEEKHLHMKGTVKFSVVNLVDLAGSERMSEVGDTNETSFINKSLFILTNVINRLADNPAGHVPYRDSKLTRILCNSLGGNAVTSIICMIAPDINNLPLSLSTLRFASRAKCIKNSPVINEVIDDAALLVTYKSKVSALESQMAAALAAKDEEIARLRMQLASKAECQEEKVIKYINISDLSYVEMYKELQKNFTHQIELKNNLMTQVNELKRQGIIGFDIQRQLFESKVDCSSIPIWEEECLKLRNSYLIELAGFDERYYSLLEKLHENLSNHKRKTSMPRPASRATSKPLTTRNSNLKVDNYRIRKPGHKVTTATARDRSKVQVTPSKKPQPATRENDSSPTPFRLICEDVSKVEEPVTESQDKTSSFDLSPETSSTETLKFNPPPVFKIPEESKGTVEVEIVKNNNVLMFGANKDGSCAFEKYDALPIFHNPEEEFVEVVCGYYHTAFINSQGVLFTVGRGVCGQLGNGKAENSHEIQPVTHPLNHVPVEAVACGFQHTLCVAKGVVFAWGYNGEGQLGLADFYDRSWPVEVEGISDVVSVSAGFSHSAAVTCNHIGFIWGSNPDGRLFRSPIQLKHQVFRKEPQPLKIDILAKQISCGTSHTLLLTPTGEVFSAGSTQHGQLGQGVNYLNYNKCFKIPVFANGSGSKIGCGDSFSAVLSKTKDLFTFGKGSFGRLGLGKTKDILQPEQIKRNKFIDFSCGGRHMIGMTEDGTMFAWGYGFYHQLGDFTQEDYHEPTPIDVTTSTGKWPKKVSCGYFHSALVTF